MVEVSLRSGLRAYLCEPGPDEPVIVVDVDRFRRCWARCRNGEQRTLATASETRLRADRKFGDAAQGFSWGIDNPVPMAEVLVTAPALVPKPWLAFWSRADRDAVDGDAAALCFDDGVTRTIWLIAEGARCFPVVCSEKDLDDVERLAGATESDALAHLSVIGRRAPKSAESEQPGE